VIGFKTFRPFVVATVLGLGLLVLPASTQVSVSSEPNVNRNGSDYANFDLQAPDPNLCRNACASDNRCAAYTYVRPGVQGANARCWLKNAAPAAQGNNCCVSGVKAGGGASAGMQIDVNLPGSDYRNFDLAVADPSQCRNACAAEGQCRAFTYVKPGVQGPNARCWLKSAAPAAQSNNCCISGLSGAAAPPRSGQLVGGNWRSPYGVTYEFVQDGANFTWYVPSTLERATGTISGDRLTASWCPGCRVTGVVRTDANGAGVRIEWDNGQVFTR
jgi:hypothetical protein